MIEVSDKAAVMEWVHVAMLVGIVVAVGYHFYLDRTEPRKKPRPRKNLDPRKANDPNRLVVNHVRHSWKDAHRRS